MRLNPQTPWKTAAAGRWLLLLCLLLPPWTLLGQQFNGRQQEVVRACGAITVALPVSEAVPIFRSERNIELIMRSAGGTNTGLDALAARAVNIALCSRDLTALDRANNPEMQLVETPMGMEVLLLAVSQDVWKGGIRELSATQVRGIYEGTLTNWKQLGGPDLKIRLFMHEQGRGTWELFVQWLYGDVKKAPLWKGDKIKTMAEARNMLEFTPGSLTVIAPSFVDNHDIFALSIRSDSGQLIPPTFENLFNKSYPLFRPLSFVTNDSPTGGAKVIIDFMTGERGQALVKQYGYLTLAEIAAAKKKIEKMDQ